MGLTLPDLAGAHKSIDRKLNGAGVAVTATFNGCGEGIIRDIPCARIPHVLHEDFCATAALARAILIVVFMKRFNVRIEMAGVIAGTLIFALRTAALPGTWCHICADELDQEPRARDQNQCAIASDQLIDDIADRKIARPNKQQCQSADEASFSPHQ